MYRSRKQRRRCTNRCTKSFRPYPISPTVAVTAEVASSSLVVPAILSKRVERISLQPTRVQKGAFLHPFCTSFRQLEAFLRVLFSVTWPHSLWISAVRFRRKYTVGSLGGIAAPCIVACQFALNKVIAYFRNRHWKRTSLQRIWASLSQQSRNCFSGRIRLRVLANCPDHSLAVDAFSMRPSVCPPGLPNIWTALPTAPD